MNDKKHNNIPIFKIRPFEKSNEIIIKISKLLNQKEKLIDDIIDIDNINDSKIIFIKENTIKLNNIDNYEIIGIIYWCNIPGNYIIQERLYPVYYLNIFYQSTNVSGTLFKFFFSFEIDKKEKDKIKNNNEYLNLKTHGKWTQYIDCDDLLINNYENDIKDILKNKGIETLSQEYDFKIYSDEKIINYITNYVKKEKQYYNDIMEKKYINFIDLNTVKKYFINLCKSLKFYQLIKIAIKYRNEQRRIDFNYNDHFDISKKIIKIDDIKQELIDNNELILD